MIDVLKMANAGLDRIVDERDDAIARAEAADATLASCNRARQAAEAECERLRAALENARSVLANLDDNLRLNRDTWTSWHSGVARQRISFVLADDNTSQDPT